MGSLGPSTRNSVSAQDIDALRSALPNTDIRDPSHPEYASSIKRWSSAASKPAGVAIVPTSPQEISIAVKYASDHGIDVAVKGGGHSTAGASSTDGGLLIDLGKMRDVRVDVDEKLFYVQGGAVWGDVDNAGYKYGLATVGGTVADTGVGGLALGGGYGWLSGKYGLVIDCMVECTVVLASGEIVKASEKENTELFWALRGAGQNFGVVTEFVLKAFEQKKEVWGGMLMYPATPENIVKVTEAINAAYVPDANGKPRVDGLGCGGVAFASPPPAEGKLMILASFFWFGSEESGREAYKELFDMGPTINAVSWLPFPEINKILAPPYGLRASMKGAAFELPLRAEFMQEMYYEYEKFMQSSNDVGISILLWELFDPRLVASLSAGSFANRGTHFNGMICPLWTDPANDKQCREWARTMNEHFKKELEQHGQKPGSGEVASVVGRGKATQFYGNYDHYDERSKDIFGENYERLAKLKGQLDPGNVFCKLFAVTPA
jgi:UDP-N-acetylenolpyruvoylglucosamine reductase